MRLVTYNNVAENLTLNEANRVPGSKTRWRLETKKRVVKARVGDRILHRFKIEDDEIEFFEGALAGEIVLSLEDRPSRFRDPLVLVPIIVALIALFGTLGQALIGKKNDGSQPDAVARPLVGSEVALQLAKFAPARQESVSDKAVINGDKNVVSQGKSSISIGD